MKAEGILLSGLLFSALIGLLAFSFNTFIPRNELIILYDAKRLFICFLILYAWLVLLYSNKLKQDAYYLLTHLNKTTLVLLSVIGIGAVIANTFSEHPLRSHTDFFYQLSLGLLSLLFALAAQHHRARIYTYLTWVSVLLFLSVLAAFWIRVYLHLDTTIHSIFGFANARFLNQMQVWLVLPTLYLAVTQQRKPLLFNLLRLTLAMHVAMFMALDARGVTIAVTTGVILWAWLDKPLRKLILKLLWQSIVFGIILKLVILEPLPAFIVYGEPFSISKIRTDSPGRLALWKESLEMAQWWGYGGDGFICRTSSSFGHPHNSALVLLVNWGIIPALAYISLLLYTFKHVVRSSRRKVRITGLSLLTGFAYSLISGVLTMPLSQLLMALTVGLFWCSLSFRNKANLTNSTTKPAYFQIFLSIIITCSVFSISTIAYKSYLRLEGYENHIEHKKVYPQFWMGYNCEKN
ncbi:O-antigen ligase family protein [Vibrio sp. 99-70-13A1]|uniref:O-antigen ligase family protein n=1 Tax=Vibrio sp. 99-70-13A1 TaxID=2607601 RepID=UPI001493B2BC|nr:O-antigen ligase family protein [Vibrio sp. 99-70-13A1]NOH97711.1 O-antigen ligase family protein [Vibrio sp. 99-70-13A1]